MSDVHVGTLATGNAEQHDASEAFRQTLIHLGHDVDREGLRETPKRFVKAMIETASPEPFTMTTFDAEGFDQLVVQTGIPFYSHCEHHVFPFFGHVDIGYIPDGRIVGLSKLARAVGHCAAGLQNQERITHAIADLLQTALAPRGVAVVVHARHLCMEMRGVCKSGAVTTTSVMTGTFRNEDSLRAEFFSLTKRVIHV